ncbi:uncharacterized protein LOC143615545 [Bidens hawaiensis]|uniref:uncharacterized protein LOC143615545 n=1 Tax=Bidens hawaiensis TaxID=980011 RepID=UPI0040490682
MARISSPVYEMKWNNWVSVKVGLLAWRAELDKLPVLTSLARRNVGVGSLDFPACSKVEETTKHIFVSCGLAQSFPKRKAKAFHAVCMATLWCLWKAGNDMVFGGLKISARSVAEDVKALSFLWKVLSSCTNIPDGFPEFVWKSISQTEMQNQFSKPMMWIGIYIAIASVFCILPMVADLLHGFKTKTLWFPCKYFTLNAASLTVIAVAMKLPVDLNNSMPNPVDQAAKLGSMAFMCIMMANLLPSLATMDSKELLTNIIALGILVITLVVNVCIQLETGVVTNYRHNYYSVRNFYNWLTAIFYVAMLLVLLMIHTCSALMILNSKQILESKYKAGHESALKDLELRQPMVEKLKQHVSNHWIMTETGSPQFTTVCSATRSASGVFKVESYCTRKLSDWKQSSIPPKLSSSRFKIVTQDLKVLVLSLCIGFQKTIVVVCKMIALIPVFFIIGVLCCFHCWKWLKVIFDASNNVSVEGPGQLQHNKDLSQYVLQLQDDMELADKTLTDISKSVNRVIERAEKQQPNNLMKLLEESSGFEKLEITLTTIAISFSNIRKTKVDRLLRSVSEGLTYVKHVEKTLNATDEYATIQKAARTLWLEVDVYHTWLGNKLSNPANQLNTPKEAVQWFNSTAEYLVTKNMKGSDDSSLYTSISANSMYQITQTILASHHANIDHVSQEELFGQLSSMISDILAACLTNLPQVILMKCHTSVIEKREESVQTAAELLGETMQIINSLQDRELPSLNPDELPFIDKWRDCFLHPSP